MSHSRHGTAVQGSRRRKPVPKLSSGGTGGVETEVVCDVECGEDGTLTVKTKTIRVMSADDGCGDGGGSDEYGAGGESGGGMNATCGMDDLGICQWCYNTDTGELVCEGRSCYGYDYGTGVCPTVY